MQRLDAKQTCRVRFNLNGRPAEVEVPPRMLLSDVLRGELGATGTRVGCEHGVCGACTVRVDGMMARSCLTFAVQIEGSNIDTIEGIAPTPAKLSVLQDSFRRHHALQCGFCTAGIVMSLDTLLRAEPDASEDRIREIVSGHLCRCTGYHAIIQAALEAADTLRKEAEIA